MLLFILSIGAFVLMAGLFAASLRKSNVNQGNFNEELGCLGQ
jgi:hypothetical protein